MTRWTRSASRWAVGLCVTAVVAGGAGGAVAAGSGRGPAGTAADGTSPAVSSGSSGPSEPSASSAGSATASADPSAAAAGTDSPAAPGTPNRLPAALGGAGAAPDAAGVAAITTPSRPAAGNAPVIVRFKPGVPATTATTSSAFAASVRQHRAVRRVTMARLGAVSYAVPEADVAAFVASMRARSDVLRVDRAQLTQLAYEPNDTGYAPYQARYLRAIGAPAAWGWSRGNSSVTVAVIDSGVDITHPDLSAKIAGRFNAVDSSSDVTDVVGHGTFVSGVAAAATDNGQGVAGIGFATRLLAVKVSDADNRIFSDAIANGVTWAADNGAKVINLSLGRTSQDATEKAAIDYARSRGVLVVAAAGNWGQEGNPIAYPAGYPGVVSVGATDAKGHRAWFSEHGSWVTIGAPGVDIFSTAPVAGSLFYPPRYATSDGTSYSSPLVAGSAALLLARSPQATPAQLLTALRSTAHGYAGFGLGAGQLDIGRAMPVVAPTTTSTLTAPADGATLAGSVTLSARSGGASTAIGFSVDGTRVALRPTVAGSPRTASFSWPTWGWAQGAHTISARDCTTAGLCSSTSASVNVTVDNTAPTLVSPADGGTGSGPVPVTVTSSGGGIAVYVDGVRRAFDGAAPYQLEINGSALADGAHTVRAVQCSASGSTCAGARSAIANVTITSLHPTIASVTPAVFSPNGDGVKETTTVSYTLRPTAQAVSVSIRNAAGNVVRGPVAVASRPAGTYTFGWNGKTNTGTAAANGTYSVRISTSSTATPGVVGLATGGVRLDTILPALTSLTGAGATFFPYPDSYRDTFSPSVTLSEPVTLALSIRNSSGAVIRNVSGGSKPAGKTALTWNGRNAAGSLVPAGSYTWRYVARDGGGSVRTTSWYAVTVSRAVLTTRTTTLTLRGARAYDWGGSAACATATGTGSTYAPNGMWLKNNCAVSNPQNGLAFYAFALPSAYRYTAIRIASTGRSHSAPSDVAAGIYSSQTDDYDVTPIKLAGTTGTVGLTFGTFPGTGHLVNRTADVLIYVPNLRAPLTDWDISNVRLTVTYQVPV